MSSSRLSFLGFEVLRLALLAFGACWLVSAYLGAQLVGGGDAVWYHHQVADALQQFRAGVFPLWVGQSEFAFNGAVHPHRSAPLLLHLAGLIDLVSGRDASPVEILNHVVVLVVAAGALSAYFALVWLNPLARWRAVWLAWLYIAAPGVIGLVVAQDLYMSLTALPFLPWAMAAAAQTTTVHRRSSPWVLGFSLGALWWAHAPIALWSSGTVGLWLVFAYLFEIRLPGALRSWLGQAVAAGVSFGAVACYPIVSVLSLRGEGEAVVPALVNRSDVLREIGGVFPALLLPLEKGAALLAYLQPGYALLLLLIGSLGLVLLGRTPGPTRVAGAGAVALLLLLCILPVPFVTAAIWQTLPEQWVSMTNLWPMQRVVPVLAALVVVMWQLARGHNSSLPRWERGVLALLVGWTAYEADALRSLAGQHRRSVEATLSLARLENVNVSAYCYQQLPQRPATFLHGVTSAEMEMRWTNVLAQSDLAASNRAFVESDTSVPWSDPQLTARENPGIFASRQTWSLEPGRTYLLSFRFARADLVGVLRLHGEFLERVYPLPSAGDALAFGTGPAQDKSLVVWTTKTDRSEQMTLEFTPTGEQAGQFDPSRFAQVRLIPIDRSKLPVRVDGLVPLRLAIQTPVPVLLDTPRMHTPGWRAFAAQDEVKVQRSPQGLVRVSVPAGLSETTLEYSGSSLLRIAFWTGSASLLIGIGLLLFVVVLTYLVPLPITSPQDTKEQAESDTAS